MSYLHTIATRIAISVSCWTRAIWLLLRSPEPIYDPDYCHARSARGRAA